MADKEDYAIVLDYLPYGYPLEGKTLPIAQAIGEKNLIILQLVPRRGVTLQPKQKVYIGEGKRDEIYYILGRLPREKLTETAKINLEEFIAESVKEREKEFVEFFNKAEAINTRVHQLELLPGFGKKHVQEIIKAREEKAFETLDEIKERISGIPNPRKAIEKRIVQELTTMERYNLFVK